MKVIYVRVESAHGAETVRCVVGIEKLESGNWAKNRKYEVTSGSSGSERKILLADDERLVVEPAADSIVEYDPVQMMAHGVPSKDRELEDAKNLEARNKEVKEAFDRQQAEKAKAQTQKVAATATATVPQQSSAAPIRPGISVSQSAPIQSSNKGGTK